MVELTQEKLHKKLCYNPENGVFYWKKNMVSAGYYNDRGYLIITIKGVDYRASRIAYLYMTGKYPEGEIDHKNRNTSDTRWCNLRDSTRSQNQSNMEVKSNNTSGYKGVYKSGKRWRAEICVGKKKVSLGNYDVAFEAAQAYDKAALEAFGEFACTNFGDNRG